MTAMGNLEISARVSYREFVAWDIGVTVDPSRLSTRSTRMSDRGKVGKLVASNPLLFSTTNSVGLDELFEKSGRIQIGK
jgi:hypothetical protein